MYSWAPLWVLVLVGTMVSYLFGFLDVSVKKKKKKRIAIDSLIDVYL